MKRSLQFIFLTLFLCVVAVDITNAQKKKVLEKKEEINVTINDLEEIYLLKSSFLEIYTGALKWVYVPSDFDSKEALRRQLFFTSIDIKELISSNERLMSDSVIRNYLELSFINIDKLISATERNMESLVTFEDYEDSVTTLKAEDLIDKQIRPMYYETDSINILLTESLEQKMQLALIEYKNLTQSKRRSRNKNLEADLLIKNYNRLVNFYKTWILNKELLVGVVNWVYLPEDILSRDLLKNDIKAIPLTIDFLRSVSASEPSVIESASLDSLSANFIRLEIISKDLIKNLNTAEDYEDPLTKLLAEDVLESKLFIFTN